MPNSVYKSVAFCTLTPVMYVIGRCKFHYYECQVERSRDLILLITFDTNDFSIAFILSITEMKIYFHFSNAQGDVFRMTFVYLFLPFCLACCSCACFMAESIRCLNLLFFFSGRFLFSSICA